MLLPLLACLLSVCFLLDLILLLLNLILLLLNVLLLWLGVSVELLVVVVHGRLNAVEGLDALGNCFLLIK